MTTIVDRYETILYVPYGKLEEVMNWCRINCSEWWLDENVELNTNNSNYKFYFKNDRDLLLFSLKWK